MLQSYKNVLATIAYYHILDHPLTTFEVWRYMFDLSSKRSRTSLIEVTALLEQLQGRGLISCESGFWFINGHEHLARKRIHQQKISIGKIKEAKRWAGRLMAAPFVRGLFLTGTLAQKRAGRMSDWDTLIVIQKKRIWAGRLFVTLFLYLTGKKRYGSKIRDRFCLNHFLTDDGLILEEQNEFTAKEISTCIPLLGSEAYRKFQQLNEFWLQGYMPNYQKDRITGGCLVKEEGSFALRVQRFSERLLEFLGLGVILDTLAKPVMVRKIQRNPLTYIEGADIRYNDQALIFLPHPQRARILQEMVRCLTKLKQ